MVSEDPMRRLCLGRLRNIPAQVVCVLLVLLQAFLINHHMSVTIHPLQWLWFTADVAITALFIASFYLREWRVKHVAVRHKDQSGFSKGLPYASVSWLVYAVVLGARIAVIFINDLQEEEQIGDLKLSICGTALICIFFTWGHHHNHESLARRASILTLVKTFTIDLLDTVDILDVLFDTAKENADTFPVVLEDIVLAVVTLNLIRPSIVLVSLFVDHFGSHTRSLKIKIIKSIIEVLLLNIPLLGIRAYLAATYDDSISVFLVKNVLGILFGLVEIYDCSYDIYKENTSDEIDFTDASKKSDNELAATVNSDKSNGEKSNGEKSNGKGTNGAYKCNEQTF